jgi:hypothetical protein
LEVFSTSTWQQVACTLPHQMMPVAPLASPGPLEGLLRRRKSLGTAAALLEDEAGAAPPWDMLQRRRSSLGLSSLFDRAVPVTVGGAVVAGAARGSGQWAEGMFEELGSSTSPVQMVPSASDDEMRLGSGQPLLEALISDPMFMSGQSLGGKPEPDIMVMGGTTACVAAGTRSAAPPGALSVKIEPFEGPMLASQSGSSSFFTPATSPEPTGLALLRKRRFDELNYNDDDDAGSDSDSGEERHVSPKEEDEEGFDNSDADAFSTSSQSSSRRSSRSMSSGIDSEPELEAASASKPPGGGKSGKSAKTSSAKRRRGAASEAVRAAMPKPPRRGRKDKTIEERCKGMSPEQARLEKNRQSAKECRLRKKEYVGNLEQKVAEFEERERLRSKELASIKAQLATLQREYDTLRA